MRRTSPLFVLFAAYSALVSAAPAISRRAANDILVMKFADVLEQLESGFYSQAISKFQDSDFSTAGFPSSQIPLEQFTSIQSDEQAHSTALQAAIKSFGDTPVTSCSFNFDSALTDVATMAATARVVENVGVAAYLGAANLISDPVVLTTAGSILTIEARHQTMLNVLSSTGTAIPAAFDIALSPSEVLAIAGPFFSGPCDLGVPANPTLSVTNTGTVAPGTLLTFQSSAMNGTVSQDQMFCQMLVGGATAAIPLPLNQCVVPDGINGPVALFITSDNQPLANDVVNRATDKIVAGPTLAFIDTKPQMIGQLARSGLGSGSGQGNNSSTVTRTIPTSEGATVAGDGGARTIDTSAITGAGTVVPIETGTAASATVTASPSDATISPSGSASDATATATDTGSASDSSAPATASGSATGTAGAPSPTASNGSTNGSSDIFVGPSNGANMYKGDTPGGVVINGWSMIPMPSST